MEKGASGGLIGIIKNLIVFLINYGYIPLQWIFKKSAKNKDGIDMTGLQVPNNKIIVVTGGSGGLGSVLVKKLLSLDTHVVAGVRHVSEMESIIEEARSETNNMIGNITLLTLDLALLSSVRNFATEVLNLEKPIGLLINAAAIQGTSYEVTRDGNEKQFQVNYLGQFLLMNLLIPNMSNSFESEPASIVNLSSIVQAHGKINLQNLNSEKWHNATQTYYNTKLYMAATSHYLGIRLKQKGINIRVNSVHPGFMGTNIWQNYCFELLRTVWMKMLPSPEHGSDDVLYVALHPDAQKVTGMFYINREVDPTVPNLKWTKMEALWDASCDLTKIQNEYSFITITTPPNDEILMVTDLDADDTNKRTRINRSNRTLSVITINSVDPSSKDTPFNYQEQNVMTPSSMAVAPLEAGSA